MTEREAPPRCRLLGTGTSSKLLNPRISATTFPTVAGCCKPVREAPPVCFSPLPPKAATGLLRLHPGLCGGSSGPSARGAPAATLPAPRRAVAERSEAAALGPAGLPSGGGAAAAAMAAPIVPESDSIRRAVSLLNAVDPGRFPRLLSRLLQKLHLKAESSFSEEEEEKLQIAFSLEKQDLHLVLETISFILEQAVYHNLKPASLQQQLQSIHLDEDKAEAFVSAWAAAGQDTIEKFRQRVLTPQKNMKKVFVEFSHQELFEFYNKLETIQAQLDSLT
ncbi:COMM domain-containing protein 10 isoform 2-T2 [Ciconia maguari]